VVASRAEPDTQLEFGVRMAQRGLWSEALFRFQQAHRALPDDFRVINNLAVAYEATGQFDEALESYRQALQMAPDNRELRRNYARFVEFYQSFRPQPAQAQDDTAGNGQGGAEAPPTGS
jgi:Flp pilus assembly protein TadD